MSIDERKKKKVTTSLFMNENHNEALQLGRSKPSTFVEPYVMLKTAMNRCLWSN